MMDGQWLPWVMTEGQVLSKAETACKLRMTKELRVKRSWTVVAMMTIFATASSIAQSPSPAAPPAATPGKFVDVTAAKGVSFTAVASHTSRKYLLETMGSGVAVFDYDNDGRLDLFFVNGAPLDDPTQKGTVPQKRSPKDWNRLYHQRKDATFEDVTDLVSVCDTCIDR